MKYYLIILFITISTSSFAQLILEHTYTKSHGVQIVNIEDEGNKYLTVDTTTKNVVLYNEDHSLWKRISTTVPSGSSFYTVTCVSKRLINLDNKIELAFSYYLSTAPYTRTSTIYNEDGIILQTFTDVIYCMPGKVNGSWKILGPVDNYTTNVYSVPGEYLGITKTNPGSGSDATAMFYPNPMDASATIKYTLPAGIHTGKLSVFDMQGKEVKAYQVTDYFSDIVISRDNLPAGTYTYRLSGDNQILSTEVFTIK